MLSGEEVKNIAALARVGLNEDEVEKYRKDLSAVLDYFQELEKLETSTTEPIGHITGANNSWREDESENFGPEGRVAILGNAPETKDGQIRVKSVL